MGIDSFFTLLNDIPNCTAHHYVGGGELYNNENPLQTPPPLTFNGGKLYDNDILTQHRTPLHWRGCVRRRVRVWLVVPGFRMRGPGNLSPDWRRVRNLPQDVLCQGEEVGMVPQVQ